MRYLVIIMVLIFSFEFAEFIYPVKGTMDIVENNTISIDTTQIVYKEFSFYVGTYTSGDSEGIYKYKLKKNGLIEEIGLSAKSENPSYLTLSNDNKFVIAVNENSIGSIESFLISGDSLILINQSLTEGKYPCHVSTNRNGYVLVSNYGSGDVSLLKLNSWGVLTELLDNELHTSDENSEPYAHSSQFELKGNGIISADLGINKMWFSSLDKIQQKLVHNGIQQSLKMPEGSGPRHFVIHPNGKWIYVVNEYGNSVTLVNKNDNGEFILDNSISTLPAEFSGSSYCADIHISVDNKFLYASNRGHNSIAIFSVNEYNGSLSIVGYELTRGSYPRNFSISPDDNYLVVANQKSNSIISFKRNLTTGLLEYVDEVTLHIPVCILFYNPIVMLLH